jgi:hypothetical protein
VTRAARPSGPAVRRTHRRSQVGRAHALGQIADERIGGVAIPSQELRVQRAARLQLFDLGVEVVTELLRPHPQRCLLVPEGLPLGERVGMDLAGPLLEFGRPRLVRMIGSGGDRREGVDLTLDLRLLPGDQRVELTGALGQQRHEDQRHDQAQDPEVILRQGGDVWTDLFGKLGHW